MTRAARRSPARGADPLAVQTLTPGDLDRLEALHARLHEQAEAPGLFVRETRDFFARHLAHDGVVLGLMAADGELAGYSVLGLPAADDPQNFGRDIDLAPAELAAVAQLDGTGIAAARQGCGLQRRMIRERLELARHAGRRIALSTAAPANLRSLSNLLAEGMTVVALVAKYDALRFVLRRDLDRPQPAPDVLRQGPIVALSDTGGHRRALDLGWRGVGLSEDASGQPALRYAAEPRAAQSTERRDGPTR